MFSRIPWDVWFALAAAIGIVLLGLADPGHVILAIYLTVCARVVADVFTEG